MRDAEILVEKVMVPAMKGYSATWLRKIVQVAFAEKMKRVSMI